METKHPEEEFIETVSEYAAHHDHVDVFYDPVYDVLTVERHVDIGEGAPPVHQMAFFRFQHDSVILYENDDGIKTFVDDLKIEDFKRTLLTDLELDATEPSE